MLRSKKNAYFVPVASQLENRDEKNRDKPNPLLADDYFHPNHKGYEKMAAAVQTAILRENAAGKIPK